jgi:hypothetical protein
MCASLTLSWFMVLAGLCFTCYQCRCPLQAGCCLDQNLLLVVFGQILGGCWLLLSTSLGLICTLYIFEVRLFTSTNYKVDTFLKRLCMFVIFRRNQVWLHGASPMASPASRRS